MRDPRAPRFIEADSLEKARLIAGETWEFPEKGSIPWGTKIIPIVVLYSIKRCGRVKARAVALGNQQDFGGQAQLY